MRTATLDIRGGRIVTLPGRVTAPRAPGTGGCGRPVADHGPRLRTSPDLAACRCLASLSGTGRAKLADALSFATEIATDARMTRIYYCAGQRVSMSAAAMGIDGQMGHSVGLVAISAVTDCARVAYAGTYVRKPQRTRPERSAAAVGPLVQPSPYGQSRMDGTGEHR